MLNPIKVPMWTAQCKNELGSLAGVLEPLALKGANLEFLLARRLDSGQGGLIFLTPLTDPAQVAVAEHLGFRQWPELHVVRVEGNNEPGLAYLMARALASERINLRAISSIAFRSQFMAYLGFDTEKDADTAMRRLSLSL